MVRWRRGGGLSDNVEDRRSTPGSSAGRGGLGGLGIPLPTGKGGIGTLILTVVIALAVSRCGVPGVGGGSGGEGGFDISDVFNQFPSAAPASGTDPIETGPDSDDELAQFMSFVLDDVQAFWTGEFESAGDRYPEATLVLFRQGVDTECGPASSATGPFYCPLDENAYLDLGFFRELRDKFGAPGDFAQAYVLAHEVGHHVQNVLGINPEVRRLQQEQPERANELSIRQELQADCLAGVWAHSAFERDVLETGDLEEGLAAAEAVGDDRIQGQAGGSVNAETWTHGSSDQRNRWFRVGFDEGDVNRCDTFAVDEGDL
jgi:predicted metalloprotease